MLTDINTNIMALLCVSNKTTCGEREVLDSITVYWPIIYPFNGVILSHVTTAMLLSTGGQCIHSFYSQYKITLTVVTYCVLPGVDCV